MLSESETIAPPDGLAIPSEPGYITFVERYQDGRYRPRTRTAAACRGGSRSNSFESRRLLRRATLGRLPQKIVLRMW